MLSLVEQVVYMARPPGRQNPMGEMRGWVMSNANDITAMTDGVSQMLDKDKALGPSIDRRNFKTSPWG
jgi:hypothetical protein